VPTSKPKAEAVSKVIYTMSGAGIDTTPIRAATTAATAE